ncbi:Muskelin N-terminus-domain-containing protein [Irpex rosettiformis]|uniref:Muskelin N-terminus-domain-containing protein n=1 Tax=Irpex rosettiformis TaxID=378272 RepID=A0ACB8TS79_9APHY|nr:Muskelin N-terminus-domain-containing protein [Irpex rosettiformis]
MSPETNGPVVTLSYSIHGCSEHSGRYVAENIMINNPQDQSSRWSGAYQTTNARQWMLLRLDSPAVLSESQVPSRFARCTDAYAFVESITFGKFHKPHPCNMKEFKLYVGQWEDNMTEVLHAGLKNDPIPETFSIRNVNEAGLTFPTRYIKIEPLSAHGHSFHTSIWFVQLNGINEEQYMERVQRKHEDYREKIVSSLILKHLRQRRLLGPFRDILSRSGMQLEHPTISALYESLVIEGNFSHCEELLRSMAELSLFSSSLLSSQPYSRWTRLHAVDADGDAPSARGGHAMCIDPENSKIYLLGGWDGQKSLDDFWMYDIKTDKWTVLSYSTSRDPHGPGPRACHKMVFDSKTGDIYVFGRLSDSRPARPESSEEPHNGGVTVSPITSPIPQTSPVAASSSRNLPTSSWSAYPAQLYRYSARGRKSGQWELVTDDTAAVGGPPLVFDHQMVVDSQTQTIYIFGGRVVDGDWDALKYSGFYSYDIKTETWAVIQSSEPDIMLPYIPSRCGHSMVFDHLMQTLFIFGGQREDKYLSDMYAYHIPTNTITELFHHFTAIGGPDACFTQRAVIDPHLREIYVFCGLTRHRSGSATVLENESPHWIYRYERPERSGKWIKMVPEESESMTEANVPGPRYAHQVAYDPIAKAVYMHGGNACLEGEVDEDATQPPPDPESAPEGRSENPQTRTEIMDDLNETKNTPRLDDFWRMTLMRPSSSDIIRRTCFVIRQQHFRELCEDSNPLKALAFLQTEVSAAVDHSDPEEAGVFRALLSHLLAPPKSKKRTRDESVAEPLEPEDDPMTTSSSPVRRAVTLPVSSASDDSSHGSILALTQDPIERAVNGGNVVSDTRFKQRTEVFERLMAYVNEDVKQPDKDLMHMINVDRSEVQ